jgi:hypothetical protein
MGKLSPFTVLQFRHAAKELLDLKFKNFQEMWQGEAILALLNR